MHIKWLSAGWIGCWLVGCTSSPAPAVRNEVLRQDSVRVTTERPFTGDFANAATSYLTVAHANGARLTASATDWRLRGIVEAAGLVHARFDQLYRGIRVWGADVIVHGTDAAITGVGGRVQRGLQLDVVPVVAAQQAMKVAKAWYAQKAASPTALRYAREQSELVVLPGDKHAPSRLAWLSVFSTERQAGIDPGRWHVFVDAKTGELVKTFNGIHTLSQASGPGGNPTFPRTWNMALDVEPSGAQFMMNTARLRTLNMMNGTEGGVDVTGALANIGDAAINDAHGYAEMTLDMLRDWFGVDSIDNQGLPIISRVHYDVDFANAYWDGTQMTYGDGADYTTVTVHAFSGALDVVSHEINHGFTNYHSNLIYEGESGGLNESFSDVAGIAAAFYAQGNSDFEVANELFSNGSALRDMCDPPVDGVSIDHYSQYQGQDVHFTSGIANKAFCRMAKRLASGSPTGAATQASVRRAAQAWFAANAAYWPGSATFEDGCQGVMEAAKAMGYSQAERDQMLASWADVGVTCTDTIRCDVTLTAASGEVTSPNYPSNYPDATTQTICIQPGALSTLTFTDFAMEDGYDFLLVRNGESGMIINRNTGANLPPDFTANAIVLSFRSDPAVNERGFRATWAAAPSPPDAATPDAAPSSPDGALGPDASGPSGDGDGGGCCQSGNGFGSAPWVLLLGAMLRRRRPARSDAPRRT